MIVKKVFAAKNRNVRGW